MLVLLLSWTSAHNNPGVLWHEKPPELYHAAAISFARMLSMSQAAQSVEVWWAGAANEWEASRMNKFCDKSLFFFHPIFCCSCARWEQAGGRREEEEEEEEDD